MPVEQKNFKKVNHSLSMVEISVLVHYLRPFPQLHKEPTVCQGQQIGSRSFISNDK